MWRRRGQRGWEGDVRVAGQAVSDAVPGERRARAGPARRIGSGGVRDAGYPGATANRGLARPRDRAGIHRARSGRRAGVGVAIGRGVRWAAGPRFRFTRRFRPPGRHPQDRGRQRITEVRRCVQAPDRARDAPHDREDIRDVGCARAVCRIARAMRGLAPGARPGHRAKPVADADRPVRAVAGC